MPQITKPLLQRGSEGPEVAYLQTLLKIAGYPTNEINGVFDFNTEHEVKSFQADNHLKINGIVDEETWNALEARVNELSGGSVGLRIPCLNIVIPTWAVILIGAIGVSAIIIYLMHIKKKR